MAHIGLPVFFVLFGAGGGMIPPLAPSALLAERYGTSWLGEIKALAMPMNVFASALIMPALMGILIDLQFRLDSDYNFNVGQCRAFLSVVAPFLWFNLLGQITLPDKLLN